MREEGRLGKSDHCILVVEMSVGRGDGKREEEMQDWKKVDWIQMEKKCCKKELRRRNGGMDQEDHVELHLKSVLWIRNYFFRIRIQIPFSSEFWIRIQIRILID
jgi:hypothetical protein